MNDPYRDAIKQLHQMIVELAQRTLTVRQYQDFAAQINGVKLQPRPLNESELEVKTEKPEIKIGDEVEIISEDDEYIPCSKFFVTDMAEDYLCGIDADGMVSFHDDSEKSFGLWRPTGRHIDVEPFLRLMRNVSFKRGKSFCQSR